MAWAIERVGRPSGRPVLHFNICERVSCTWSSNRSITPRREITFFSLRPQGFSASGHDAEFICSEVHGRSAGSCSHHSAARVDCAHRLVVYSTGPPRGVPNSHVTSAPNIPILFDPALSIRSLAAHATLDPPAWLSSL